MFTIDVEKTNDVAVVRCIGRIVRGEAVRTLRHAAVSQSDTRILVLDLSEVESLDGGGLSALVSLYHWARDLGIQLKLVNPSLFVREILDRTGLSCIFEVSCLDDALLVLIAPECSVPRNSAYLHP